MRNAPVATVKVAAIVRSSNYSAGAQRNSSVTNIRTGGYDNMHWRRCSEYSFNISLEARLPCPPGLHSE
jgi:hypothetical protein